MTELGIMGGTRDFLPQEMNRREYVIDRMKQVFRKYGFEPLETPSIERWETLAGKYGEEGEKLIYHVISSGKLREALKQETDEPNFLVSYLNEAESRLALRYDLTVPLSRVMGMYGDQTYPDPSDAKGKRQLRKLARPFKRYQIQPVWRGDRPGAGRYREFFQCDVDVIGAESLLVEAELVAIGSEILSSLGFPSFTIRMNHRKLLTGLIQWSGIPKNQEAVALTAVDKLDKATPEEVQQELLAKNCAKETVEKLFKVIGLEGNSLEVLAQAQELLVESPLALAGIQDLEKVLGHLKDYEVPEQNYKVDLTLARGLDYYTGTIFETVTPANIGSIGGGGRYDRLIHDLSDGKIDLPAVGTSFGLDRLLTALEMLDLLQTVPPISEVLVTRFTDPGAATLGLNLTKQLRHEGIRTEIFYGDEPFSPNEMRKQLGYANEKKITYVLILGPSEIESGVVALRNMNDRSQQMVPLNEIVSLLKYLCRG